MAGLKDFQLLIVDDDDIFNQQMHSFLTSKGVKADSVLTLAEAKDYLLHQRPNLILLDYMLKDEMGIELMSYLEHLGLTMPVMMVTADDDQDTMRQCFERGIDDYLLKPLNLELLWLKIKRLYTTDQLQKEVAQQANMLQALLDEKHHEEALARHLYEHMANNGKQYNGLVQSLMKSSTAFNGDTLLVSQPPTGNTYIILMDATGHGLAAAISILPLVSAFYAMVEKGLELPSIIYELNQKLNESLPDDRFVAAIFIEINKHNRQLRIWNGGMPDVLMLDNRGTLYAANPSTNLPLGIVGGTDIDVSLQSIDVSQGGHLLLCSDGLLEQMTNNGSTFGKQRLYDILEQSQPQHFISSIENAFTQFLGDGVQSDDVSVCHVDMNTLLSNEEHNDVKLKTMPGQMQLHLQMQGSQLQHFDVMPCLDKVMAQFHMPMELRRKSYTVCAELITNAIDHGVLRIPSTLKSEENGFIKFLDARNQRLQQLNAKDSIRLEMDYDNQSAQVEFKISDSGTGYDPEMIPQQHITNLSGRGLNLINSLSQHIHYSAKYNQTSVIIK
ncbi:fused response regulator/phosphatase [Alteromonadaceae bacterium BrNp21-10]|nr:fused response regulator/phosphatase [Alteromonadaceae bacterium BrNp21-10]